MKDVFDVLQQKEAALACVRKQVESLNIAAPLLAEKDDEDNSADDLDEDEPASKRANRKPSASAIDTDSHQKSEWNTESSPFLNALKSAL